MCGQGPARSRPPALSLVAWAVPGSLDAADTPRAACRPCPRGWSSLLCGTEGGGWPRCHAASPCPAACRRVFARSSVVLLERSRLFIRCLRPGGGVVPYSQQALLLGLAPVVRVPWRNSRDRRAGGRDGKGGTPHLPCPLLAGEGGRVASRRPTCVPRGTDSARLHARRALSLKKAGGVSGARECG